MDSVRLLYESELALGRLFDSTATGSFRRYQVSRGGRRPRTETPAKRLLNSREALIITSS